MRRKKINFSLPRKTTICRVEFFLTCTRFVRGGILSGRCPIGEISQWRRRLSNRGHSSASIDHRASPGKDTPCCRRRRQIQCIKAHPRRKLIDLHSPYRRTALVHTHGAGFKFLNAITTQYYLTNTPLDM